MEHGGGERTLPSVRAQAVARRTCAVFVPLKVKVNCSRTPELHAVFGL